MIQVVFMWSERSLSYSLPVAPRKGEKILLDEVNKWFEVEEVRWSVSLRGIMTAEVHLIDRSQGPERTKG